MQVLVMRHASATCLPMLEGIHRESGYDGDPFGIAIAQHELRELEIGLRECDSQMQTWMNAGSQPQRMELHTQRALMITRFLSPLGGRAVGTTRGSCHGPQARAASAKCATFR